MQPIDSIQLDGIQCDPPGEMTVTLHMKNGDRIIAIKTMANVISHFVVVDRLLEKADGLGSGFPTDDVRTSHEKMKAALRTVQMLRQLGGMMPGVREVVMLAVDQADEALATSP